MPDLVPTDPTPRQLCALALQQGAAIDVIERFSALAERWEATEAKKKWSEAIAGFKNDCPPILKKNVVMDKNNKQLYKFASYDDIKAITIPLERKWGIVTGFSYENTTEKSLKAVLKVTVGSHTEEFIGAVPVPTTAAGGINATQLMGQAQSYVKRYLYLAAFDLVVAGEDSDAADLMERMSPEQFEKINTLLDEIEAKKIKFKKDAFLGVFGVESVEDLAPADFDKVIKMLSDRLIRGAKQ